MDFGCGCGRVLRWFQNQRNYYHFFGTDIDPEPIEWCRKNIYGVDWRTNTPLPPTSYDDKIFDLVYAISVFTHLNEEYQSAWLGEVRRITRPGGLVIATVHGDSVISKKPFTRAQTRVLEEKGFLFIEGTTGIFKLDGLPDFYQTAFHTSDYISREWSRFFVVVIQFHE